MKPWMQKAEHALATGQPNLAMLYMRRGLQENERGRRWLASYDFDRSMRQFWRELQAIARPAIEFVTAAANTSQDDVALAGQSKGGA